MLQVPRSEINRLQRDHLCFVFCEPDGFWLSKSIYPLTQRPIAGISLPVIAIDFITVVATAPDEQESFFSNLLLQARSSVGERYLDVVEVGGSIPPAPTRFVERGFADGIICSSMADRGAYFFYQWVDKNFIAVSLNCIDGWAGVKLNNDDYDEQQHN